MFSEPSGEVIILEKWGMLASPLNQPDLESLWGKKMWEVCKSQRHIEIILKKHSCKRCFCLPWVCQQQLPKRSTPPPLLNPYMIVSFLWKISYILLLLWNTKKPYNLSSGMCGPMKSSEKTGWIPRRGGGLEVLNK